jgi:hypothetical protein
MCKPTELLLFTDDPAPVVAVPFAVSVKSPKAVGPVWTVNPTLAPVDDKGSKAGKPIMPPPGGSPARLTPALLGAPADAATKVALTMKEVDSPFKTLRSVGETVMTKS